MSELSKTVIQFMEPQDEANYGLPDLVFLDVDDVILIKSRYHIIHHKYYDVENGRMTYVVGPPADQHPNASTVSVGWSEGVQPS